MLRTPLVRCAAADSSSLPCSVWNEQYKSWSQFAQDHVAKRLLGIDSKDSAHDAATDARKSMQLFHLFNELQASDPQPRAAYYTASLIQPFHCRTCPGPAHGQTTGGAG